MTDHTPKAFSFEDEPAPAPAPVPAKPLAAPKAFDFGEEEVAAPAPAPAAPAPAPAAPVGVSAPKAMSFDEDEEVSAPGPAKAPAAPPVRVMPRALFDSEDHPAVRDALSVVQTDYPELFHKSHQRLAAMFRRILPVKLSLVTQWAEEPLMEQASLLQPMTEMVRSFSQLEVPTLLNTALESTRPATGVLGKLFSRSGSPAQHKPALVSAREKLQQLMIDSEVATRNLDESAKNLTLHWVVLAVVSELAGRAHDTTLLDVLLQRRTLIQQAVRQAELSILQMGQVRQQAAELIGQVSSFLTVTLPAIEMAQSQGGS